MAKKQEQEAPKSKKKLILIICLVVLLLLLGGGGYTGFAYFTNSGPFAPKVPTAEELAQEAKIKEAQMKLAVEERVVYFDSAFTFNLVENERRQRMVQIELAMVALGPENEALAQKHKQLIASEVSDLLSKQDYSSLIAQSGRQRLKHLLLESIRARMMSTINKPVVDQILIVNFVMQ